MTLVLDRGTRPKGLEVKTTGAPTIGILLGDYELSMEDFLLAAAYVLTNSDLEGEEEEDPRRQFVIFASSLQEQPSTNVDKTRLFSTTPPIPGLDEG